jgi:hypothetical protein
MPPAARGPTLAGHREEDTMEVFWAIVVYAFVLGVLGLTAFALARMLDLGHRHHGH